VRKRAAVPAVATSIASLGCESCEGGGAVARDGDGGGVVVQREGQAEASEGGEHGAGVLGVEAAAQRGGSFGEGGEDQGAVGEALRAGRGQLGEDRPGGRAHTDAGGRGRV
jgi:hypothetical protein